MLLLSLHIFLKEFIHIQIGAINKAYKLDILLIS